jgi:glyoxylase-like metal-dependent hydrolase (beta-lactamase superfamily II)
MDTFPIPLYAARAGAAAAFAVVSLLAPVTARAATESPAAKINEAAAKANVEAVKIREHMTVLMGSGGNITVLDTPEGKLLVDAGIHLTEPKLKAALNNISAGPLKYVINTHYHWDHTDGNTWMHNAGATIIAQQNVLKRVSEVTRVEDWNFTFPPLPPGGRPTILVKNNKTMKFGGSTIDMKHFGNGHTDGDLWVYFRKEKVLVLGDTFWNNAFPFIDNAHGGSIDTQIAWATKAVEQSSGDTVIVPGHGPVGKRADLIAFRDMLVAVRKNVAALKAQQKTLDEIIAAKPTADFDARFGGFVIAPDAFTRLVYNGLK